MMDPHAILMIRIEKPREEIDDEELAVMRSLGRLSSDELTQCVARGELDTWIDERWPNHRAHHDLIRFMLFTEPSFSARDARDETRWLPTLRGFERIDICLRGRRLTMPPPEPRPLPSTPAPEMTPTEPVMPPTDTTPPEPIPCEPPPPSPSVDLAPDIEEVPVSLDALVAVEEIAETTPPPSLDVVLDEEPEPPTLTAEPLSLEPLAPPSKPLSLEEQAEELEREASRLDDEAVRLTAEAATHRVQAAALREQIKTSKVALAQEKLRRAQADLQNALADLNLDI
ncbi:hypothetical protein KBA73_02230 [Patescibacteria group bacterium]|nr:hypothetical protein [Patescibacteria group bacterium]